MGRVIGALLRRAADRLDPVGRPPQPRHPHPTESTIRVHPTPVENFMNEEARDTRQRDALSMLDDNVEGYCLFRLVRYSHGGLAVLISGRWPEEEYGALAATAANTARALA